MLLASRSHARTPPAQVDRLSRSATGNFNVRTQSVRPTDNAGAGNGGRLPQRSRCAPKLVEFFIAKGLPALKDEDRREQWYDDWIAYQAKHRLYATMISPARFSSLGNKFDLLRYARFLEVFAYFSPAHGYSLQCTFLGLFAILMGSNDALKREAVASLEAGGLCAFGVSEQCHGSDLFGNEFTVVPNDSGALTANGTKYYIGNANVASLISVLSRKGDAAGTPRSKRAPFVLFALRPGLAAANLNVRKIRTLGIRAAFVAEIQVKDYVFLATDIIASGRQAWDAFFGAVTLGKFFLSFGSIGICEHALAESVAHLSGRILFGKPVIEMPHIRRKMSQAYARLAGMKLYAYRALDYVHAASHRPPIPVLLLRAKGKSQHRRRHGDGGPLRMHQRQRI